MSYSCPFGLGCEVSTGTRAPACVKKKVAQTSASWLSTGGCSQRQSMPQAALRFGEPRPVRSGPAVRALLSTARAGVGPGVPLLHAVDDDLAIFGREPLEESRHTHGADDDADDEDAPSGILSLALQNIQRTRAPLLNSWQPLPPLSSTPPVASHQKKPVAGRFRKIFVDTCPRPPRSTRLT